MPVLNGRVREEREEEKRRKRERGGIDETIMERKRE